MAQIDDKLEDRLRLASPQYSLSVGFTERVMLKTVYRNPGVRQRDYRWYQLRLAGVSMILAGCLIMAANITPVSGNLDTIKSSLRIAVDQVPQVTMPWFNYQYSKTKGEVRP